MRTHVFSLYVAATPGDVWAALTEPQLTPRFSFGLRPASDWTQGGTIAFHSADMVVAAGELVRVEPGRALMYSLADPRDEQSPPDPDVPDPRPASWVSWELEQREDGVTRVRLVVDELEDDGLDEGDETEHVWARLLSNLKTLLETGTGLIPRQQGARLPEAG